MTKYLNIKIVILFFVFIYSCNSLRNKKFYRNWTVHEMGIPDNSISDTVNNNFLAFAELKKNGSSIFDSVFKIQLKFAWIKPKCEGVFRIVSESKINIDNASTRRVIKCEYGLDSSREDHLSTLIFVDGIGLVFESNPNNKSAFILINMIESYSKDTLYKINYDFLKDTVLFPLPPRPF